MRKRARMLLDILQRNDLNGIEGPDGCYKAALELFLLIREIQGEHIVRRALAHRETPPTPDEMRTITDRGKLQGEQIARRIFAQWGTPPTAKKIGMIKNWGLLDLYDLMKEPNVQELARKLAEENKALPRAQQRGPGATDPVTLEKQIRRQVTLRKARIKKGTWLGPIPATE
jgi:hypothetical protein